MPSPPSSKEFLITTNDTNIKSSSRKSRLKFDFPIETLIALSHFRQDEAARILGVASITLKRNCQRQNYRWPYRTIKAQRRREARLAAQKMHTGKAFLDPSLPSPRLLPTLKHANSPSSVSGLITSVISKPMVCPQLPLAYKSMTSKLPPLKLLLHNLKLQSMPTTPPRLNTVRPMHHHPVEQKNSFYCASSHLKLPKLPLEKSF